MANDVKEALPEIPKAYCIKCGAQLVKRKESTKGRYWSNTGRPVIFFKMVCPNRERWFDGHSCDWYRYSSAESDDLWYRG